jgi:hypothetical protein
MQDSERGSSDDSDSEATVLPKGGSWEGESPIPEPEVGELKDGVPVIAELDMNCLGPSFKRIEIGIHKDTGQVAISTSGFELENDMIDFVTSFVNPSFVLRNYYTALANQGANEDGG